MDTPAVVALNEALRLAEHGYKVTPVTITRAANGKKAARFHNGWRHESAWSRDPGQIRAWWVDHPDTSFAIGCAVNGIEGPDLDVKPAEGIDGVTWWGSQGLPLSPLVQYTPSGGMHLIWKVRADGRTLPQEAGKTFGRGVDTRNRAGLFFAAGSYIVGEEGHYAIAGPLPRLADLAETPDEVIELFAAAAERERVERPADGRIVTHDKKWQRAQVELALQAIRGHRRDESNYRKKLQHAGLFLGRAVEQGFLAPEAAEQQILDAHRSVWGPEVWPENRKDVRDALKDGPRLERWRVPAPVTNGSAHGADGFFEDRLRTSLPAAAPAQVVQDESETQPGGMARFLLPASVWEHSPLMQHIYRAAMARLVSPDALLHAMFAIVASLLHHKSRIETGKGGSVLSYYLAAVGASGAGKSEALKVARELLEGWSADRFAITGGDGYVEGPLGSGEGLVEAFMGELVRERTGEDGHPILNSDGSAKTEKVRAQVRHNGLFHTDEGRQVLAIDSRKGATVLAVLCEMWSGAVAGQTNAEAARTRKLAAGSYVVGMMLGFQTATIDALFADEAGGAPQRFAFAPAEYAPFADDLDNDDEPEWPGALELDVPVAEIVVQLSSEQRREVRRHVKLKAAGLSGDGPLDGHRMLLRCRVAGLLALLHGEDTVSDDTWNLSNVIVSASCSLRDWLAELGTRRVQEQAAARQRDAVETHVRAAARASANDRIVRAAGQIARAVERAGGVLTRGKALHGIRSDLRDVREQALDYAAETGLVALSPDGKAVSLATE